MFSIVMPAYNQKIDDSLFGDYRVEHEILSITAFSYDSVTVLVWALYVRLADRFSNDMHGQIIIASGSR